MINNQIQNCMAIKSHKKQTRPARSTTQARCITILWHCLKNYTLIFEHGFLPFINDHSFNVGYVTIMPCERSHKRKFSTTLLFGTALSAEYSNCCTLCQSFWLLTIKIFFHKKKRYSVPLPIVRTYQML